MAFRVTLSKVRVEELSFSVWPNIGEALAHMGELMDELGLGDIVEVRCHQSPVTGELLKLTVTQEAESGTRNTD